VREVDIICTATTSSTPVFEGNDLNRGTHINAIGGFMPQMQEVDETTIKRADKIVVDSIENCLVESGDLIIPIEKGVITKDDIYAELGEVASGLKPGREREDEITYFRTVGTAVQDVSTAHFILEKTNLMSMGRKVEI